MHINSKNISRRAIFKGLFLTTAMTSITAPVARAQFVVLDPINLIQNIIKVIGQITQIANEISQIANQVEQIVVAVNQYKNQIENTLGLPNKVYTDVAGHINDLAGLIGTGNSLGYTLSNINQIYQDEYGKYSDYLDPAFDAEAFSEKYKIWSDRNTDTIGASMQAVNLNMGQMNDEQVIIDQLKSNNDDEGRNALLQNANAIGVEELSQLQKLRQLTATNIQMQSANLAKANAVRDAEQARNELYWRNEEVTPSKQEY